MTVAPTTPTTAAETATHRERAFEAVFATHWTRLFTVLARTLGDEALAEEAAQEAFWRLYQRPPQEWRNVGGWLYKVALHVGYNALRTAKRRLNHESQVSAPALSHPEAEAEQALTQAAVRAALAELPPRDAQALLLRHSGFSYQEIASALGLAPNAVGTLLARAEAKFAQVFARHHPGDVP